MNLLCRKPSAWSPKSGFLRVCGRPLATSVHFCVGGHGTHHGRRTGLDLSSLLNDSLQSRMHISATLCH